MKFEGSSSATFSYSLVVMIIAIGLFVAIMMAFAVPLGKFVNKYPTIQMLSRSFLILIAFLLIAEAAHMVHLIEGII